MKSKLIPLAFGIGALLVFNVLFFVISGVEHPASVWVSYAFIHAAFIAFIVVGLMSPKGKSSAELGFSIVLLAGLCLVTELIAGLIFIIIALDEIDVALAVQLIMFGIFVVFFIAVAVANKNTERHEATYRSEVFFIKDTSSRVKRLIESSEDARIKRVLEGVHDCVHSCPSKSNAAVEGIESDLLNMVALLEEAVGMGNVQEIETLSKSIKHLCWERNRMLQDLQ